MKKKILLVGILITGSVLALIISPRATAPDNKSKKTQNTENTPVASEQVPGFNKRLYSLSDPESPWVIVNKVSALPSNYVPSDLTSPVIGGFVRSQAAAALNNMTTAAGLKGINLTMLSGYRSFNTQTSTYNAFVAQDGQADADTYSARPGHSEHQSGWAVDLGGGSCGLQTCFGETAAGKWLAVHAHEYGFIIRYLPGKEAITGYQYEPWHLRYVGLELSNELYKTGQTMEEFFNVVPTKQPY